MNKKAIELSINFLVIIIVSLAVFGMGILFVNKIFFAAGKKITEMDQQTKEELARLLDDGSKVAMPFFQKTVIHGNTATFGIGVLNTLGSAKDFTVVVKFDEAFKKDDTSICNAGDTNDCGSDPDGAGTPTDNGWLAYDHNLHNINNNEQKIYTIAISPPKSPLPPAGTYIFDVAVCYDPEPNPIYLAGGTDDPYKTASAICTPINTNYYGYYHLQKIWLSVK